jgi:hypothetical protein
VRLHGYFLSDDEEAAAGAAAAGVEAGVLLPEELESVLDFESLLGFESPLFESPFLALSLLFALAPSPEDLGLALP